MDFKAMHSTDPWYSTPKQPAPHAGFEKIDIAAAIFFTDLAKTPASWRPHVEFSYGLELSIKVSPPDSGTFANLEDAQAWCRSTAAEVRYCKQLVATHATNVSLTTGFGRGMATFPREQSNAQPHNQGS
jgi:hypothetical protein